MHETKMHENQQNKILLYTRLYNVTCPTIICPTIIYPAIICPAIIYPAIICPTIICPTIICPTIQNTNYLQDILCVGQIICRTNLLNSMGNTMHFSQCHICNLFKFYLNHLFSSNLSKRQHVKLCFSQSSVLKNLILRVFNENSPPP